MLSSFNSECNQYIFPSDSFITPTPTPKLPPSDCKETSQSILQIFGCHNYQHIDPICSFTITSGAGNMQSLLKDGNVHGLDKEHYNISCANKEHNMAQYLVPLHLRVLYFPNIQSFRFQVDYSVLLERVPFS